MKNSIFVPKGIDIPSLNYDKLWAFEPSKSLKVGSMITGGDMIG